jgi:hypothetical protein
MVYKSFKPRDDIPNHRTDGSGLGMIAVLEQKFF